MLAALLRKKFPGWNLDVTINACSQVLCTFVFKDESFLEAAAYAKKGAVDGG